MTEPNGPDQIETGSTEYQVLARKYRPQTFSELIGQDALVRTLSNAINENRIAHAFILTGVRGVGKTTTARIIAKALNCIGADGSRDMATTEPCGVCDNCIAITDSRHMDIMEMDAASRTGINDIRELIDGVQYLPVQARTKIYIIDEVHMLSTQAFNGLLKTLEEPPAHVKFIFATTEIRKIPVTILSRCQRFDLRRVDIDELVTHFSKVAAAEGAELDDESLRLIAASAEGSVRDGMSILDQAISHGGGKVDAGQVRDMLGLADRGRIFDLFETVMKGDTAAALELLAEQYAQGADPIIVLQDLLELSHWLTRLRVAGTGGMSLSDGEKSRGEAMAKQLGLAQLGRAWQMLLKGLSEARMAPAALSAVEMVLIRLCHAANMPTPDDLIRQLNEEGTTGGAPGNGTHARGSVGNGGGGTAQAVAQQPTPTQTAADPSPTSAPRALKLVQNTTHADPLTEEVTPDSLAEDAAPDDLPTVSMDLLELESPADTLEAEAIAAGISDEDALASSGGAHVTDFEGIVALAELRREAKFCHDLRHGVHLISFSQGQLEVRLNKFAPNNLAPDLAQKLEAWTGETWRVIVNRDQTGAPTLAEQAAAKAEALRETARAHPLVKAALEAFPNAKVDAVRDLSEEGEQAVNPITDKTQNGEEIK